MLKNCPLKDQVNEGLIMMPKELTADNGAKSLLIGEFHETVIMQCEDCEGEGLIHYEGDPETCEDCNGAGDYALKVTVGWDTIKNIYDMCVQHFQNKLEQMGE
jgi:excinuclease UvrABC ATPase subunit